MRFLRLDGDFLRWEAAPLAEHPGGVWAAAEAGLDETRGWLCPRWLAIAATAVARRRPGYAAAKAGVDWQAAGHALSELAPPTRRAVARAAMVGDSVTATRASRWRGV